MFATGYALLELALGVSGREPGIAHFAAAWPAHSC
jgi:hypothetical protein